MLQRCILKTGTMHPENRRSMQHETDSLIQHEYIFLAYPYVHSHRQGRRVNYAGSPVAKATATASICLSMVMLADFIIQHHQYGFCKRRKERNGSRRTLGGNMIEKWFPPTT